jgi:flavin reductase
MINPADFKNGMRHLAAAVNVITTQHMGKKAGMTATAVCSLTAEPPLLLVCININAFSHEIIRRSGRFVVNVLSTDDVAVANRFAGGDVENRFQTGDWAELPSGGLALSSAVVSFDCSLSGDIPVSTHSIFLGRVEQVVVHSERASLLYAGGKYSGVGSLD